MVSTGSPYHSITMQEEHRVVERSFEELRWEEMRAGGGAAAAAASQPPAVLPVRLDKPALLQLRVVDGLEPLAVSADGSDCVGLRRLC